MKTKEQLKEEFESRRWDLLDWLNSGEDYNDEIIAIVDEMELILQKIKEIENGKSEKEGI